MTVNEETADSSRAPGRSAIVSTIILLAIYAIIAAAAQAFGGTQALVDNSDDVLSGLADGVLGPFAFILLIAVLTSAAASTQTTILPTARTTLVSWNASRPPVRARARSPTASSRRRDRRRCRSAGR